MKPRLKLKVAEFDAFMAGLECHTDGARAEALGVARTVVQKTRNGQAVSAEFIAAVQVHFPRVPFDRFFTVEMVDR